MSTQQEHEIVPAIRDWLAATTGMEIPLGLSPTDARRGAREFLSAIAAGTVLPDNVEMDDELKDILWASVGELSDKPLGHPTFEESDRLYQFVAALPMGNDPFDERDDLLNSVARIGWRSAPGGLDTVLNARGVVWEHGGEQSHREILETAAELPARIEALVGQQVLEISEIREICSRLVKLSSIRPGLVAPCSSQLYTILDTQDTCVGHLDDRAHLKAIAALAAAMADRHHGNWNSCESGYRRAASAFRCTADVGDQDRVEVEYLALQYTRGKYHNVVGTAPELIERIVIPRERQKAKLVLGSAFISLERPADARRVLETALVDSAVGTDPCLEAAVLSVLGSAFSFLGEDLEAMARFNAAGALLARFHYPLLLATLTLQIGEHLGKLGKLRETLVLYRAAREMHRDVGHTFQVAYLSVLVSEVLMLLGRSDDAEIELVAALPLIERFELHREAVAAVALLREAMMRRGTDVTAIQALRDQLRKGSD